MNEQALIKIQSKVMGLDRELHKLINELINGQSLLSDEHLTIMINSTERELNVYNHILKLIINNQNVN
jgi:hypothetical protein